MKLILSILNSPLVKQCVSRLFNKSTKLSILPALVAVLIPIIIKDKETYEFLVNNILDREFINPEFTRQFWYVVVSIIFIACVALSLYFLFKKDGAISTYRKNELANVESEIALAKKKLELERIKLENLDKFLTLYKDKKQITEAVDLLKRLK